MSENQCLFCLESDVLLIKKSCCQCKIYAHEICWEAYEMRKGFVECPICHLKTEISPLQIAMKRYLRESIIVEMPNSDDDTGFQKGLICCCLGYFTACGILAAVFG